MTSTLSVSSVSKAVISLLNTSVLCGKVLGRHAHAYNIELATSHVITLVDDTVGNGPLNIVVNDLSPIRASGLRFEEVFLDKTHLQIGSIDISLIEAVLWDPRPDWRRLRKACEMSPIHLDQALKFSRRHAAPGSMLDLLSPVPSGPSHNAFEQSLFDEFSKIIHGMQTGKQNSLRSGAAALSGLGSGLTPAGDDFLLGIMLFAWLRRDSATRICRRLADAAGQQTTGLSASLLNQAALGHCSNDWHNLFESMSADDDALIDQSIAALVSCGHTSGSDALAGFIWAGHHEYLIV